MWVECRPGITSTFASPVKRQNGYSALIDGSSATSGLISPSYSKSTLRESRMATASRIGKLRSFGGSPKVECDSSATRGSCPRLRAAAAAPVAMSATSSALGRKLTCESAMKIVRPRMPNSSVRPNARLPGALPMAWPTPSRHTAAERVRPVTIASASPNATMQAAKTLRSWFTRRWQSRRRNPFRWSRPYRKSVYFSLVADKRALWISIPSAVPAPRAAMVAWTRSSRPISTGLP